jgi:hypothetical protein
MKAFQCVNANGGGEATTAAATIKGPEFFHVQQENNSELNNSNNTKLNQTRKTTPDTRACTHAADRLKGNGKRKKNPGRTTAADPQ